MRFVRSIKAASVFEYSIGIAATCLIAFGPVSDYGLEVARQYGKIAHVVEGVGHRTTTPPTAKKTPKAPPFVPDHISDCGPYLAQKYGFIKNGPSVEIVVPGSLIGISGPNNFSYGTHTTLTGLNPLGSPDSRYLLAIEYDGVHEFFQDHDYVSVFDMNGNKIINRSLVKIDSPDDIHQGDEYLIALTHDLVIDLNGFYKANETRSYTLADKVGHPDFGNNDGLLQFRDIGCVMYPDGSYYDAYTSNQLIDPTPTPDQPVASSDGTGETSSRSASSVPGPGQSGASSSQKSKGKGDKT